MRQHKSDFMEYMRMHYKTAKHILCASGVHSLHRAQLGVRLDEIDLTDETDGRHRRDLLNCISEYYDIPKENILPTLGSSSANFLACALFLDRDKEVIIEDPVYEPLYQTAMVFRPKVKRLPRLYEEGYQINTAKLKKMVSKKTKLIIITNLHNPSGVWIKPEDMREIGDIAANVGAYVLSDEVYLDFARIGGQKEQYIPSFKVHPHIITTSSLTKVYGLGSLRVGWAFAPEKVAYWMARFHDTMAVEMSFPGEAIALAAFRRMQKLHKYVHSIIDPNFRLVHKWMSGRKDMEWVAPHWGTICFPRLKSKKITSFKLVEHLFRKYNTFVTPGEFFGQPKHIRIGLGSEVEDVRTSLKYLDRALEELS